MSNDYYTEMNISSPPVPPPRPPATAPRPPPSPKPNTKKAYSQDCDYNEIDDYIDADSDWKSPKTSSSLRQQSFPFSSKPPPPTFPPPPTNAPPPLPNGSKAPALPPPRTKNLSMSPPMFPPLNQGIKYPSSPPPLPPPRGQTDNVYSDDLYSDVDYGPPGNSEPVSDTIGVRLTSFTNDHQTEFPTVMEVTTGYLNTGEDCSMSEGEKFVVHFTKQTKVITMQDEQEERYNLPLNTPFEFGLIHDPNNNQKEALSGFVFKTARDVMLSRHLPKVVRARKAFRGISPEHSVEMNDLLFVKEMVQKEGELRYLKCIRAVNGDERHLHDNCAGQFSTSPYDVRMMLPDIVKHFQFPLKAVFYTNTDIEEEIPTYLVSSVVTISSLRTEESLITTPLPEDEEEDDFVLETSEQIIRVHIPQLPRRWKWSQVNQGILSLGSKEGTLEETWTSSLCEEEEGQVPYCH